MGIIDDIFGSSYDKGKSDGAEGKVDSIRCAWDKDYEEGADYGQGRTEGSKIARDEDKSCVVQIAVDALFQREALEKMGKSEAYKRGYDWGKETYGKKKCEVDNLRRASGGRKDSSDSRGADGGSYGGSVGYGHGKESPWLLIIGGLLLSFIIFCGIICLLSSSPVWRSPSPHEYEFDYESYYTGHSGVPVGNINAVPSDKSIVLIPSESTPFSLTPQSDCNSDSYFTDYENGWYVNSTTLHSSPDDGKTWYILLTVENMPESYYREIMRFHDVERKEGAWERHLAIHLMGDLQSEIRSVDGGRSWRHIEFKYGGGYVIRRTYNQGKTWVVG